MVSKKMAAAQAFPSDRASNLATILFLGQTGTRKGDAVQQLLSEAMQKDIHEGERGPLQSFELEDYLAQRLSVREFLARDRIDRQEDWQAACKRVVEVSDSSTSHRAILMHGYYWYRGELFTHIDLASLRALRPTAVVTFIDDVFDVHTRIMDRERGFETGASNLLLPELLTWRWAEIGLGELIARNVRDTPIPHFLVPAKHSVTTLWQLLFQRRTLKVYASFPITKTRQERSRISDEQRQQLIREIDEFRTALRAEGHTVMDPLTVDEYRMNEEGKLIPRWPIDDLPPMVPPESDLASATLSQLNQKDIREPLLKQISAQVSARDFRLIDPADAVACYRPRAFDGLPSTGTSEELRYGQKRAKATVAVHEADQDGGDYYGAGGPFDNQFSPAVYPDTGGVLGDLRELQEHLRRGFDRDEEPQAWSEECVTRQISL